MDPASSRRGGPASAAAATAVWGLLLQQVAAAGAADPNITETTAPTSSPSTAAAVGENCPCENGGTCYMESPGIPGCSCLLGFTGERCEVETEGPHPLLYAVGIPVSMVAIVLLFTLVGAGMYYWLVVRRRRDYVMHRGSGSAVSYEARARDAAAPSFELDSSPGWTDDRVNILEREQARPV